MNCCGCSDISNLLHFSPSPGVATVSLAVNSSLGEGCGGFLLPGFPSAGIKAVVFCGGFFFPLSILL